MSYARNTHRETYDCRYAEANAEHFSQPGVRWKWQEVVRFMKSVLFDPITGDPTGDDYGNQTGGLRFEASTNRFRYKGASSTDATVQWRYFGSGDGDVSYFGTEQADNGVARWHSVTRQIQGSRATLDDNGNFETDGRYATTQGSDFDDAFKATVVDDDEPMYLVRANGQTLWGPGGATPVDTDLTRLGVNHLGSDEPDAKFSLREGDSRIAAQRHLGGLGNAQGASNYRCPVVAAVLPYMGNSTHGTLGGSDSIMTHNIPIRGLEDGDTLTVDVFFETRDPDAKGYLKSFKLTLNTTPNIEVEMPIAGGEFAGWIKFTLVRLNSNDCVITAVGMHGGSTLITSTLGNTAFNTDASPVWNTNGHQIELIGTVTGNGIDTVDTGEWTIHGGRITYYNF